MTCYGLTPKSAEAAVKLHGTIFFDWNLNPVKPVEGQWFCEFDLVIPEAREPFLRDEALVEYLGPAESLRSEAAGFARAGEHRVMPEHSDCDRPPRGVVLIAQG